MTDRYVPISCDTHSQLELAIVQHRSLQARWRDGNVWRDTLVTPLDLRTERGEEFLLCRLAGGEEIRIRLDHLARFTIA